MNPRHCLNSVTCCCALHLGVVNVCWDYFRKFRAKREFVSSPQGIWCASFQQRNDRFFFFLQRASVIDRDHASCLFLTWVETRWSWLLLFFHKYFISLHWRLITEVYIKTEGRGVSHIIYRFLQLFWITLLWSFIPLLKYDTYKKLLPDHHNSLKNLQLTAGSFQWKIISNCSSTN